MSQNVDICLSFDFMKCRNWKYRNLKKNDIKLPDFLHKIITRTYITNLRHASLKGNLRNKHRKIHFDNIDRN